MLAAQTYKNYLIMENKIVASLTYPTPEWLRKTVRFCTWLTAIYAFLSIQVNLTDFGVSIATENLILKYMAVFSGLVSVVARFVGVKPVHFDTDEPLKQS